MSNTFIHYLGGFYFQWSLFEIHVEMICLKELGITPRQVHILLGSLSFSSKQEGCHFSTQGGRQPPQDRIDFGTEKNTADSASESYHPQPNNHEQ